MMETTTIVKERTETVSGSLYVNFNASRKDGEPFLKVDAYVYNGGQRIGMAFILRDKDARFFQERLTSITVEEWVAVYGCITRTFDEILNESI